MPSEAKFSPAFQDVRPEMVPLHSFCQIFLPIRSVSACESSIACACRATASKTAIATPPIRSGRPLDGMTFSDSMTLSAAGAFRVSRKFPLSMKRFAIFVVAVSLTSAVIAQDKSPTQGQLPLKDQKDKVSYSI